MAYDIYCKFDLEKHKAKYVNYLEVLIEYDGTVVYAVPSHQEKAADLACERLCISKEELARRCPPEFYFDYLNWLLMQSGAIAVWSHACIAPAATVKQVGTLRKLKMAGVFTGAIPKISQK